ncbi:MAG: PAS domain-containing protein [Polyangiaceae bacterium]|nr:PAS domain-containing protein [Polyangiaceae bacterium]
MPRRRSLIWLLFAAFLAVVLAAAWVVAGMVEHWNLDRTKVSLEADAWLFSAAAEQLLAPSRREELQRLCHEYGRRSNLRLTVILPDGTVVAESEKDPRRLVNHSDRPEFAAARAGKVGVAVRPSATLKRDMVYVTVPVTAPDGVRAVVRAAVPLAHVREAYKSELASAAFGGVLVLAFAAVLAWLTALWLNHPLRRLRSDLLRFGEGDLSHRLSVPGIEEYGALAETMNRLAAQLEERVRTITEQHDELEAVLAGMVEAVLVVDADDRIVRMNRAAALLFGVDPDAARGKALYRVIRDSDLTNLVNRTRAGSDVVEAEIATHIAGERILQAHGTHLPDDRGRPAGALVVLNDVTRLKKLESMRRDFVANVSHELRTPITSIKGFVETLRDGALEDHENARGFLDIVARHADRLNAIIEDLLALSRLERDAESGAIAREPAPLRPILEAAISLCVPVATARGVRIELDCDGALEACVNAALLEQAVVNLLNNAANFSEPDTVATLAVRRDPVSGEVSVEVRDQGCGIPAEHLPRIFERFYRVDKARSRKQGGTGLGLAIVKHIAQACGGSVSVESEVGRGSAFAIRLPG